ncbi:putative inorganic phosphate cotransporter [Halotydeus destructor]|nr:putative inorganic phosphate cotransporter [Halotydeus destructor]
MATASDYMTRVNINVAIVSMVKRPTVSESDTKYDVCPMSSTLGFSPNTSLTIKSEIGSPTYDWDAKTQGVILGAFYYSYFLLQIPVGRLAELFGAKWIIAAGMLGSGLINVVTPSLTYSTNLFIFSRFAIGILQAGIFPAGYGLLCNWFPSNERGLAFGVQDSGRILGIIISAILTGFLCDHGGWPSAFYIAGTSAFISSAIFVTYVTNSPEDNFRVSEKELRHIQQDIGDDTVRTKELVPVPWKSILTTPSVWALIFAHFSTAWQSLMQDSKIPTYMSDVLRVSSTANGILNALLYLATCTTTAIGGPLSEWLISSERLSRSNTRKLFLGVCCLGTAACLTLVTTVGCHQWAVVVLLILSQLCIGLNSGGTHPVASEMTRHFPSTLFALSNTFAMSTGFLAPYFVGTVLQSELPIMAAWTVVFISSACLALAGAIVFTCFGDAQVQPWDGLESKKLPTDYGTLHTDNTQKAPI